MSKVKSIKYRIVPMKGSPLSAPSQWSHYPGDSAMSKDEAREAVNYLAERGNEVIYETEDGYSEHINRW